MKFPLKGAGNSIGSILGLISLIICIFAPWATGISSANKSRIESNPLPENDAAQKARVTNFNRAKIGETFNQLPLRFEQNAGQFLKPIQFFCRGNGYELALANNEFVVKLEKAKEREWKVSEEVVGDCERLKLPPSAFCLSPLSSKFLPISQWQKTTSTEVVTGKDLVNSDPRSTPAYASSSAALATVKMHFIGNISTTHIAGLNPLATKSNYFTGNNPKDWPDGAIFLLNDKEMNSERFSTEVIKSKKALKKIRAAGGILQVRNSNGSLSNTFIYN